jgi:hypothetical protein
MVRTRLRISFTNCLTENSETRIRPRPRITLCILKDFTREFWPQNRKLFLDAS